MLRLTFLGNVTIVLEINALSNITGAQFWGGIFYVLLEEHRRLELEENLEAAIYKKRGIWTQMNLLKITEQG